MCRWWARGAAAVLILVIAGLFSRRARGAAAFVLLVVAGMIFPGEQCGHCSDAQVNAIVHASDHVPGWVNRTCMIAVMVLVRIVEVFA